MNKDWLDIDVLEDYLDGKLDAKGMHFVERQALDDPFIAEALEGLRQSSKRKQTLSILQKQLYDRVSEKPIKRKMWGITTQRLSIAATATVAFIAVSILFFMRETNRKYAEIALRKSHGVIVNLDTNTTLATVKPKIEDSATKANALIDKAIVNSKTADLAKINKQVAKVRTVEPDVYSNRKNIADESVAVASETLQSRAMAKAAFVPVIENKTINGKVVSEFDGQPLPGVTIKIADLNKSTVTDKNGLFTLTIDSTKAKSLMVSYLGFENIVASIDKQKNLTIALKEDHAILNEVVAVGYGATGDRKSAALNTPSVTGNKVVFSGNVVDQSNGKPIQGAIVKLAGSKSVTATDANGFFALPVDSNAKDKDLLINAVGFKEVPVRGNDPNAIRSAMSGDKSLNEIALIMGSNGRKSENIPAPKITLVAEQNLNGKSLNEITKPVPVSTINYNQYLEHNNRLYNSKGPEQYVILSFKVNKSGRPTNLAVLKSLNSKADAEAKRLIQTGPDWVLPKNGIDTVEISIKF